MKIRLGEDNITLTTISTFLNNPNIQISISDSQRKKVSASRNVVLNIASSQKIVYGINTGFGALSDKFIAQDQLAQLQLNLIRSHCTGVGEMLGTDWVKTMMLLRAHCLAIGYSGIQIEAIELLVSFIENNIIPQIPRKGSVGASGDLAPLAHLALCLIGEGNVLFKGQVISSLNAMHECKLRPIVLGAKDGLALINGTTLMATLSSTACNRANNLFKLADVAAAMTLEATRGTRKAFDPKIASLKKHPGQLQVVENFVLLTPESEISKSHADCGKVQDPYSIRCVQQVHGACRQTLIHCQEVTETELNSVTDNPLIFSEDEVISGGNFHGEALALVMDYLCLGVSELCNISERRVEKMMNPTFSGLAPFLVPSSGLNSGLMIAQVTAAALVSENKILAHPASVDSIPTSTDKEDHVSMGVTAGLKLHQVLDNLEYCLAIEFLCNVQALYLLRPLKSSPAIEAVLGLIRGKVTPIIEDRNFSIDIEAICSFIKSGDLLKACENITGPLL